MSTESFNILLADDDKTLRCVMQVALEQAGLTVATASNGEEAIHMFNESPSHMVMLDVEMPRKNGYEVCSYLRKNYGEELPIIMVTGMNDVKSIDLAFELGATDFIAKPINWNLISYQILHLKRAYLNLIDLKHANARSKAIFNALPDTMFILNNDGIVIDVLSDSAAFSDLQIHPGTPLEQRFEENIVKKYLGAIAQARQELSIKHFEFRMSFDKSGTRHYECRIVTIDSNETLCLLRDITNRIVNENKIFRLAYFDVLTGLPNRQSFLEKLKRKIPRAKEVQNKLAILFLGLDGFKCINDAMGHNIGDKILRSAADRLQKNIRTSDFLACGSQENQDITIGELARIGGDEFTMIVTNLPREKDASIMAQRICEIMQQPYHPDGHDIILSASIGIAIYPTDGEDAETLLKHADTALDHAKSEGRNNCQFYSSALTDQAQKKLNLENDIRHALLKNEFQLVYQPQYDIYSSTVKSVEALIRWNHPEQGFISPLDFIPLSEENGLIIPIGEWVLRTACSEAMQWKANQIDLKISVNLSPIQFNSPDIVESIFSILDETGFPPNNLVLEVTEHTLMQHSEKVLNTLHTLRDHHIQISLDDFGTGYSSLNYLKHLPIHNIKIDKIFVDDMLEDKDSLAIIRSIISLSNNLGFTVTAEGIETLNQASVLKYLGCNTLQGFYFSKPVDFQEIYTLAKKKWLIQATQPEPIRLNSR